MTVLPLGVPIAKSTFSAAVWQAGCAHLLGTFANTHTGVDDLAHHVIHARIWSSN